MKVLVTNDDGVGSPGCTPWRGRWWTTATT